MENMANVIAASSAPRVDSPHGLHSPTQISSSGAEPFSVAIQSALSRRAVVAPLTSAKHIPIAEQHTKMDGHGFQERALNVQAYRLQVIASNIANADTPGYKAVDIDYRAALLQSKGEPAASPIPLKYQLPAQGSVDGNTVDLDVERAKFTESMIKYQFSLDRVSGHYKMMSELFNSLKD